MRHALLALTLALGSTLAGAQPASEASVNELLAVTQASRMMDVMVANVESAMRAGLQQAAGGRPLTDEQRRVLDALPARMAQVMREEMGWDVLRPGMVQIYRETLSQDEVDGLIAFHKTPAGQAMINKMPLIMQRSMALTQSRMATFGPRMQSAIEQALRDAGIPTGR
jgi:hypothetical protein